MKEFDQVSQEPPLCRPTLCLTPTASFDCDHRSKVNSRMGSKVPQSRRSDWRIRCDAATARDLGRSLLSQNVANWQLLLLLSPVNRMDLSSFLVAWLFLKFLFSFHYRFQHLPLFSTDKRAEAVCRSPDFFLFQRGYLAVCCLQNADWGQFQKSHITVFPKFFGRPRFRALCVHSIIALISVGRVALP